MASYTEVRDPLTCASGRIKQPLLRSPLQKSLLARSFSASVPSRCFVINFMWRTGWQHNLEEFGAAAAVGGWVEAKGWGGGGGVGSTVVGKIVLVSLDILFICVFMLRRVKDENKYKTELVRNIERQAESKKLKNPSGRDQNHNPKSPKIKENRKISPSSSAASIHKLERSLNPLFEWALLFVMVNFCAIIICKFCAGYGSIHGAPRGTIAPYTCPLATIEFNTLVQPSHVIFQLSCRQYQLLYGSTTRIICYNRPV